MCALMRAPIETRGQLARIASLPTEPSHQPLCLILIDCILQGHLPFLFSTPFQRYMTQRGNRS